MKKRKLLYLLMLLLFTVTMLSTSTYAWFTSNRVVTINSINVHVQAAGGLEISADGTNWKSILTPEDILNAREDAYPTSVNQIPSYLEPVSTGKEIDGSNGYLKMYYGLTDNNDDGEYVLTSTRVNENEFINNPDEGKFIVFDIFLKVSSDTPIYLTNNSKITYLSEDGTGKGIASATRVAFVNEGVIETGASVQEIQALKNATSQSTYIWEPNYDKHTPAAVSNAFDTYGITTTQTNAGIINYDGLVSEFSRDENILLKDAKNSKHPNYFKPVNINFYTKEDFTEYQELLTLKPGITKLRVYMWIEGQDVDCENNASYDDIQFDLQLSVNPS